MNLLNEIPVNELRKILDEASGIIRDFYITRKYSISYKNDSSIVTNVDILISDLLEKRLKKLNRQWGLLSEENCPNENLESCAWVIDPLDGTREFVASIPEFAISIGLLCSGELRLGAIINPVTNEWAVGYSQEKIFHTNIKRECELPRKSLYISNTEYDGVVKNIGILKNYEVIRKGSVAYRIMLAASNDESLAYCVDSRNLWDIAAGAAIMNSLNKDIVDMKGSLLRFSLSKLRTDGGFVCGKKELCHDLLGLVNK